jgi:hypothetical protein
MENTISFLTEGTSDSDLSFIASSILLEADRVVGGIQTIVAALLCYAATGMSVTGGLIELMAPGISEESGK